MSARLRAPLLVSMLLAAAVGAVAQRRSPPPPSPPSSDDLQETLEWLGRHLKQYGRMTLSSPSAPGVAERTSFDGMRVDGCRITYRIKRVTSYPPSRDAMSDPAGGTSYSEYEVDLRDLDPSLVKAESPKNWRGGRVVFSAGRGRPAVTNRTRGGKVAAFDGGEFYVSEPAALDVIAEALRRAISMCRE